jgi:hypothetical protein
MNSGMVSPNPAELIESPGHDHVLLTKELNEYNYIIVDTSPWVWYQMPNRL